MLSELIRIPYDVAGVPIFGFGVLLAAWAVLSGVVIFRQVRRQGWSGDTVSSLPVLLFVGGAIVMLPRIFPGGLPIRGYGVMLLAGISSGVALAVIRARRVGLDHEYLLSLTIWLVIGGVLGARLFYVVEYWEQKFSGHDLRQTLVEIINIPEGGLVVYGGLFGATAAFLLFTRLHKLPVLPLADMIAPSLAIGLALGRIGCFLNGCCYGGESDLPWAVTFPKYSTSYESNKPAERRLSPPYADQAASGRLHGFQLESRNGDGIAVAHVASDSPAAAAGLRAGDVVAAINARPVHTLSAAQAEIVESLTAGRDLRLTLRGGSMAVIAEAQLPARSRPVQPAQIYSAIDAALLCWLVWSFYPLRTRDGQAIALLLSVHPLSRFLLEIVRTDEPAVFGTGLSISQNISIVVFVCALGLWWYLSGRPKGVFQWSAWRPARVVEGVPGPRRRPS